MREDDFKLVVLGAVVERLVELLELRVVGDEVGKPVFGDDGFAVEPYRKARVEIRVHLEAARDEFFAEAEILEYGGVGLELHERAVRLWRLERRALLRDEFAELEDGLGEFAVAHAAHAEILGKRVHGFRAHAVHAHGKLERVGVELAACVDLGHAVHHLAERYAASAVAHRDRPRIPVEGYVYALSAAHYEFVHGVVHDLLQEDVYAVFVMRAVRGAADVHSRARADVFER